MRRVAPALLVIATAACGTAKGGAPAASPDGGPAAAAVTPAAGDLVFVDVAVATMDVPRLTEHQTVVIRGDTIEAIGPVDRTAVPAGALVVQGRGKVLIPGLHDMHVHLDGTRAMLDDFLEAGVTTVRNMAGSARTLALRDRIARGELLGPRIYTATPFVDGPRPRWEHSWVVRNAADAARVVDETRSAGYDFIKVYNMLSLPAYDALYDAARARGVRLVGHVPFAVPLAHALERQATIEHLTGYAVALERPDSPVRHKWGTPNVIRRWMYADPSRIPELAAATARAHVWSCPTLVTAVVYGELQRGRIPYAPDLDEVSPDWRARWDPAHSPMHLKKAVRRAMEQAHDKVLATQLAMVHALAAAGAPLLAGTDTPNPYVVPGASLHQELALLVGAGLSPYDALRAATREPGEFLGDPRDGHIAIGARADLVLLDGDPLADIHAIDRIAGVAVRGRWLSADQLRARHDARIAVYRAPPWEAPVALADVAPHAHPAQFTLTENGAPAGAYAIAQRGQTVIERRTLEDETITMRTVFDAAHRARSVTVDIDRLEGASHAEHVARERQLIGWLSPVSARALVAQTPLEVGQKAELDVIAPDLTEPAKLLPGHVTITRLPDEHAGRAFRLRLAIDHGAWAARLVFGPKDEIRAFWIDATSRPLVRAWHRRR